MTLDAIKQRLSVFTDKKKFLIAYSGGLDSHVLLHLMSELSQSAGLTIRAVHVNHGLQKESAAWAAHCRTICDSLSVPYFLVDLKLAEQSGESLEALARDARYQAIEKILKNDEVLLTAQHQDDQAETLLLQLFRGAGVDGLASMPRCSLLGKSLHIRPLLDYSRRELQEYAKRHRLDYIEDPSNQEQRFDRNFLRLTILPQLEKRWKGIKRVLSRAAAHQSETKALLDEFAAQDLQAVQGDTKDRILISRLKSFSRQRQALLLRYWIKQQGFRAPSEKKLSHLFEDVINCREDARPLLHWRGAEIRRFQDNLYIMPPLIPHDAQQVINWDLKKSLAFPALHLELDPLKIKQFLPDLDKPVTVRFRQGGEKIYLADRKTNVSLKKLFQEARIPPWRRSRIPLVYHGDDLVCVVDVYPGSDMSRK